MIHINYRKYINMDNICFRQCITLSTTNNSSVFARPNYSMSIRYFCSAICFLKFIQVFSLFWTRLLKFCAPVSMHILSNYGRYPRSTYFHNGVGMHELILQNKFKLKFSQLTLTVRTRGHKIILITHSP